MKKTDSPHAAAIAFSGGSLVALLRFGVAAVLGVILESPSVSAAFIAPLRPQPSDVLTLVGPRITSPTDWWLTGVGRGRYFRLEPISPGGAEPKEADALTDHAQVSVSSTTLPRTRRWAREYAWHVDFNEIPSLPGEGALPDWLEQARLPALASPARPRLNPFETLRAEPALGLTALLRAPRPAEAPVFLDAPCASWRQPRPISFEGLGGEGARLTLVDCEGGVTQQAIERLSVLGRAPGTPAPSLPLPLEPAGEPLVEHEWVTGVHLLHPRLLTLLQQIALAFPARSIALYSAYRRDGRASSPHRRGRAVDIEVKGVANESLFAFCRTLNDAGCGYYPHHPFVHVDVRSPSEGSVYWVDISEPGHPSVYVDAWPGVVARGALEAPDAD